MHRAWLRRTNCISRRKKTCAPPQKNEILPWFIGYVLWFENTAEAVNSGRTYNSKEGCHCHRLCVVDEVRGSVEERVPRPHHAAHREGVQDDGKRLRRLLYHVYTGHRCGTVTNRLIGITLANQGEFSCRDQCTITFKCARQDLAR